MPLYVLNRGFGMLLVLCRNVKIHYVLDAQRNISEGNILAFQRVWKSRHENLNNWAPQRFYPPTTPSHHLVIWLVESSEEMLWRHHRPEVVKLFNPGMSIEGAHYAVHPILNHAEIDGMKNIGLNNSHWGDAVILQKMPCEVRTTETSRYCHASCLSVSFPWVTSAMSGTYSRQSHNCHDDEFPSPIEDFGALHSRQWGCWNECKCMCSK